MCTMIVFDGMMAVYFVRMWRVYKVFGLYQKYLDHQLNNDSHEDSVIFQSATLITDADFSESVDQIERAPSASEL
jgi:hypothetical protein